MFHRLPFLFLLSVICYLFTAAPIFAQEVTPNVAPIVTSNSTIYPQASETAWDNFLKNLIPDQFKQIPDTLHIVNCSNLPSEVCDSIKSTTVQTNANNQTNNNTSPNIVRPQSANDVDKKNIVSDTAGLYTIASGINTPPEISHASTNIASMFAGIINFFDQIFHRGNKEAQNFAEVALPQNAIDNGVSDSKRNTSMEKALPLRQCGNLPAGLCDKDNNLHISQ